MNEVELMKVVNSFKGCGGLRVVAVAEADDQGPYMVIRLDACPLRFTPHYEGAAFGVSEQCGPWVPVAAYNGRTESATANPKNWESCIVKYESREFSEILAFFAPIWYQGKEFEYLKNDIPTNNPNTCANLIRYGEYWSELGKMGRSILNGLAGETFTIKLDTGKKRHQLIGLPQTLVKYVEYSFGGDSSSVIASIQNAVSEDNPVDGNDLTGFVEWLEAYEAMEQFVPDSWAEMLHRISWGKTVSQNEYGQYISLIGEVHKKTGMPFCRIAEYLSKQVLLQMDYGYGKDARVLVLVPTDLAREYRDYICDMNAPELTPADFMLEKAHLAARLNIEIEDEDADAFARRSAILGAELNAVVDGYQFTVPASYRELVDVGIEFRNCLPSCGHSFIVGLINIVFVTPPGASKPMYALEVGMNGQILQEVRERDLPIEDETVLAVINKYSAALRRKKIEAV